MEAIPEKVYQYFEPIITWKRQVKEKERPLLKKSEDVFKALSFLQDSPVETFYCLWLDASLKLIALIQTSKGTIDQSSVYVREICRQAILFNSSRLIIAHNHPSGNTTPSLADKLITYDIVKAGKILEFEVLDHIIIGLDSFYSFADAGERSISGLKEE